jgi:hypothetical protein
MSIKKPIEEQNLPDLFYVFLVFILIIKKLILLIFKPFIYIYNLII